MTHATTQVSLRWRGSGQTTSKPTTLAYWLFWAESCWETTETRPFFKKRNYLWLHWVFIAACRHSSCGEWASQCGGFSCCAARALGCASSGVVATSRVASRHVESSQTRDWTHVPCIGMWTPNHWTTREARDKTFLKSPLMPQSIICTGMRGGNLITGGREQPRQESA